MKTKDQTTSLIIPCHPKHAQYLYELLKMYEQQTILPDEVVISLSEAKQVDQNTINALQNEKWSFPVKLLLSEKKLFAGQNRNIACKNTVGEIIICQDADDFPHPQRIEIIKYFFDKFKIDFLLHKFIYNNAENNEIEKIKMVDNFPAIKHESIHTYHEAWIVGYMLFGQPAFRREILQKIQWRDIPIDEDNVFANQAITQFKALMVHVSLYIYRSELSATPYELYRNMFKKNKKSSIGAQ